MSEIREILKKIHILREDLNRLIKSNQGDLADPQILEASKKLDLVLNEYNRMIENKIKNT